LGYDVSERRLIVNETEAVTVREIFERYLSLGSVRLLRNDLERRGAVSKVRVSRSDIKTGGRSFSRGALDELLSNPIYIGEVRHKQERHPGQHEAIIERGLWEQLTTEGIRIVLKISIPYDPRACQAGSKVLRISRFVPMKLKRRGVELRIILDGKDEIRRKIDPALLKAIARARRWLQHEGDRPLALAAREAVCTQESLPIIFALS
jgi:hypothetical protein